MRSLAVSLAVTLSSACAESPPSDTATVRITNADGVPIPRWPVAFQTGDGRLLDWTRTDDRGEATGPMEPDGMVTYRAAIVDDWLVTRAQIQPGDYIWNAPQPAPIGPTSTLIVNTTNVPARGILSSVVVPCGDHAIEGRGVPGYDITLEIPTNCDPALLLATVTDNRYATVAYHRIDHPALSTRITVDAWNTELFAVPVTVTGVDADVWNYTIFAQPMIGDASVAWASADGDAAVDGALTATLGVPLDQGTTRFDVDVHYPDAELHVSYPQLTSAPFALEPVELPPRMTQIALEPTDDTWRPTITFRTNAPLDRGIEGDTTVNAVLYGGGGSTWILENMPGPDVRVPEFPDIFDRPFVPDMTLIGVGATTRMPSPNGDIVRTTGMPYVPSTTELPI